MRHATLNMIPGEKLNTGLLMSAYHGSIREDKNSVYRIWESVQPISAHFELSEVHVEKWFEIVNEGQIGDVLKTSRQQEQE
jgi:hypothetical protein